MNKIIDVLTHAVDAAWDNTPVERDHCCKFFAQAAAEALGAAGYVIVPRKPNEAMVEAGGNCGGFELDGDTGTIYPAPIWRAMVAAAADTVPPDPRDPDHSREGMFVLHNCARCRSGENPCVRGNPRQCEFPHARND